ncbi:hypothetical protein BH23ACT10_BH23ACT10_02850 [soil metagenome]
MVVDHSSWGVGPKKFTEHFAYLLCFRNHVTLGFFQGGALADPHGLLPVSDKQQVKGTLSMRSLKLKAEQVDSPALRDLVDAAVALRRETS